MAEVPPDRAISSPHFGMLELDDDLVVRRVDAGLVALAGAREGRLVGRPLDALFSARDRRGAWQFHELVSHGAFDRVDLLITLQLGDRELPSRLQLSRTAAGFTAVVEDLGAPGNLVVDLHGTAELWREIVRQSVEGVALLDEGGRILQFNPTFFRLLDLRSTRNVPLSEEAVRGATLAELVSDPALSTLRAWLQRPAEGRPALELEVQHRGRALEFASRPFALPRRRLAFVCVLVRDVSARRRAELLRADLDAARDELLRKEKLAALGGLVTGVAHEINTPLGVAVTATSLAQDRLDEIHTAFASGSLRQKDLRNNLDRALEAAGIALANLRRAAALVANFKQIAVDQASEVRRDLSLGQYVREVVASLSPLYSRTYHEVSVDVRADPVVTTFAGAISQICTNLLQNALVHAFPSGQVGTVTLWVDRPAEAQLELGCRDDGVGMSPEVARRIYEPFFTTARGRGGSGLGLHIVHNLVTDLLRGTIATDSSPGRGTAVTIRFPERPEAPDVDPRR